MHNKAQASLEYLMTYGWALILIASVVSVFVFVVGTPSETTIFHSSDPAKILFKGSTISGNDIDIVMQNITGGKILINAITFSGDFGDSPKFKFNNQVLDEASDFPVNVNAGGLLHLEGITMSNNGENGIIEIAYLDAIGLQMNTSIVSGSGGITGLIASYGFEENAKDGSGNKLHAITFGSPTFVSDCPHGKCLQFNGLTQYVECNGTTCDPDIPPANGRLDNLNAFTYTAWIKPTSLKAYNSIFAKNSWNNFFFLTTTELRGYVYCNTVSATSTSNGAGFEPNSWYFVAMTFDDAGDNLIHFYKNGEELSLSTAIPCSDGISTNSSYPLHPLLIGKTIASDGEYFSGFIDESKIYNRALSPSEICTECNRFSSNVGVACNC